MQMQKTHLTRAGQTVFGLLAVGALAAVGVTSAQASTVTGLEATAPATVIKTGVIKTGVLEASAPATVIKTGIYSGYGYDGLSAAHWKWAATPNTVNGAGPGFWEGNPIYTMLRLSELIKR